MGYPQFWMGYKSSFSHQVAMSGGYPQSAPGPAFGRCGCALGPGAQDADKACNDRHWNSKDGGF